MKEKKIWKKYSVFQIVSFVLVVVLIVAIIVQIGIMINLKNKTNEKERENEELENSPITNQTWEVDFYKNIDFLTNNQI